MSFEDDLDKCANSEAVPSKRRLRLELSTEWKEKLVDSNVFSSSLRSNKTHPDWVKVDDAKQKFSQRIQDFYGGRYPDLKMIADDHNDVNFTFRCDTVITVTFRIQYKGLDWPMDTLVIVNIHKIRLDGCDPCLELLSFITSVQREVGYFYVGLEYPSGHERQLIKRFGFDETEELVNRWSVSIMTLTERIETEIKVNRDLK